MQERLQKIIAASGLTSRRKAEEWIQQGKVLVNGEKATLGMTADIQCDQIFVDGKPLPVSLQKLYIMLHKPRGYVTTLSDERGRPTVSDLVSECPDRVYPIGRLDMDSEGLLLLTNDGDFANKLMHPSHDVEKEYLVKVSGYAPGKELLLERPIELDGYRIKKPQVMLVSADKDQAQLCIVIHEGRNRQIRRMCEAADMKVLRLKRVREGQVCLGNLPRGKWRSLTSEELSNLKK